MASSAYHDAEDEPPSEETEVEIIRPTAVYAVRPTEIENVQPVEVEIAQPAEVEVLSSAEADIVSPAEVPRPVEFEFVKIRAARPTEVEPALLESPPGRSVSPEWADAQSVGSGAEVPPEAVETAPEPVAADPAEVVPEPAEALRPPPVPVRRDLMMRSAARRDSPERASLASSEASGARDEVLTSPPGAAAEWSSDAYLTASSEASLVSLEEAGGAGGAGGGAAAGHVAAMRERFESMSRAATPGPDLLRAASPARDAPALY